MVTLNYVSKMLFVWTSVWGTNKQQPNNVCGGVITIPQREHVRKSIKICYSYHSKLHSKLHFTTYLSRFWKKFTLALHARPEESVLRVRSAALEERRL